jgi:hypothetical protein
MQQQTMLPTLSREGVSDAATQKNQCCTIVISCSQALNSEIDASAVQVLSREAVATIQHHLSVQPTVSAKCAVVLCV